MQAEMDKVTKVATLVGGRMARLVVDARKNASGNTQLVDELKRYNRRLEARARLPRPPRGPPGRLPRARAAPRSLRSGPGQLWGVGASRARLAEPGACAAWGGGRAALCVCSSRDAAATSAQPACTSSDAPQRR